MLTTEKLIKKLNLQPLPEGGYFCRIYEASTKDLSGRRYGAAIYYLLEKPDFSCFHRVDCDELWHFYAGEPVKLYQINPAGKLKTTLLGNPLVIKNAQPVAVIEKGHWFAAEVVSPSGLSLMGCTTVPEFSYAAYELAKAGDLASQFPEHAELITRLTQT